MHSLIFVKRHEIYQKITARKFWRQNFFCRKLVIRQICLLATKVCLQVLLNGIKPVKIACFHTWLHKGRFPEKNAFLQALPELLSPPPPNHPPPFPHSVVIVATASSTTISHVRNLNRHVESIRLSCQPPPPQQFNSALHQLRQIKDRIWSLLSAALLWVSSAAADKNRLNQMSTLQYMSPVFRITDEVMWKCLDEEAEATCYHTSLLPAMALDCIKVSE